VFLALLIANSLSSEDDCDCSNSFAALDEVDEEEDGTEGCFSTYLVLEMIGEVKAALSAINLGELSTGSIILLELCCV